jgi:DNA-binding transcriptional MerR regulator
MNRGNSRSLRRTGTTRRQPTFVTRRYLCHVSGISEQQLAIWEQEELLRPARVAKVGGRSEVLYPPEAIARVRLIRTLAEELEVNLPGIDVILNLLERLNR